MGSNDARSHVIRTVSMAWITPLPEEMSVASIFASPTTVESFMSPELTGIECPSETECAALIEQVYLSLLQKHLRE